MTMQAPVKNRRQSAAERDERGRFLPGNKGGPGRPPAPFSVRELLRGKVADRPKTVERILDLCESEDEHVAVRAILGLAAFLDGTKTGGDVTVNIDNRRLVVRQNGEKE